jgi:DNA-binding CsgD family transcriptional regulator
MPQKCFVANGTARYEVHDYSLDEDGLSYEWRPVCAHHGEYLAENGYQVRVADDVAIQNPPAWAEGARLGSVEIPAPVLDHRYDADLSPMQAVCYHLCDADDGPNLTQQRAADAIGTSRDQLYTHIRRARDKLPYSD